jgi:aromatic ring-cleaving dioxygenase
VRIPHSMVQIKFRAAYRRMIKESHRKAQAEQKRIEAIQAIDKIVEEHKAAMKRVEAAATAFGQLVVTCGEIAKKTREMVEANKKKRAAR